MKKQVMNPYLPSWEYIPDGEPHVFGGRLYIFGSHDRFGGGDYCQNDYLGWSAPVEDLSDWTCHGVIYRKAQHPGNTDGNLFAPDVARGPDGRYYLFYSMANSSVISVAVSNTPAGDYEYYGDIVKPDGTVLGKGEHDAFQFDPAVLVDDDGRIYLYSGQKPPLVKHMPGVTAPQDMLGSFVTELAPDMKTAISEPVPVMKRKLSVGLHNFFEASSIRKFDGRYYFIYSSNFSHELCYSVSDKPTGPFEYQGVLLSNGNIGLPGRKRTSYSMGNNHGSVEKIGDSYYVFGHRHTNNDGFTRQAIAQKIELTADGRFIMAEYTSSGMNDGPIEGKGEYPAYIACHLAGKKRPFITQSGPDRDGGEDQFVTNWKNCGTVGFAYFNFNSTKSHALSLRGNAAGEIYVSAAPVDLVLAVLPVSVHDSAWTEITGPVSFPKGAHGLYLTFRGKGSLDFMTFTIA